MSLKNYVKYLILYYRMLNSMMSKKIYGDSSKSFRIKLFITTF